MSCVFLVTPLIASWPLFAAAAASVAATLGYRLLNETETQNIEAQKVVEIKAGNNKLLEEMLDTKGNFALTKEGITVKLEKNLRGYCKISACGGQVSEAELQRAGKEIFDKIMQEYAYRKVKADLLARGFSITEEKVDDSGTIQIQVRKWS